ncbi:hypothetical protein FACS189413_08780 [Bacteroidia bacterium]|nr:hypothetical protein FACS189413_08780 [Bacteroidia bacterium]
MWKIEIIQDWNKIWEPVFQAKWLKIMAESPNAHVFFHPALIKAWEQALRASKPLKPLFIIGTEDNSNIEVIFPLVFWCQNWKNAFQKQIVPIGANDFDYHDPVFSKTVNEETMQSFYHTLLPLLPDCDVIRFDGLHKKYMPQSFEIRSETLCPYFHIESFSTIEDYTKTLKKSFVSDYVRTTKRLTEKYGPVSTRFYSSNEMETALCQLDKMLEIHRKRWPKAYKVPHFHANLLKEGLTNQVLLFAETSVENQPVAWYICFIYKEKLMLYMPAIVPEFQVYSPGKINLLACVNYAIENRLKMVDHLKGDESYKRIWANQEDTVYDVEMKSKALVSRIKESLLILKKKYLK